MDPNNRTDDDWRAQLTPEQYEILRRRGTEPPGSGAYLFNKASGMYACAACGSELFRSDAKFDSGTGWPSFSEPANRANIELKPDNAYGLQRTEVTCKTCGGHLGHVFADGPAETGGQRYCINSAALDFRAD